MSQLHWEFANTGGGDRTGDNDPVVTPFRGNIYYVLARESIQNIIDAHIPNSKEPAKASFTLRSVYPKDLPGFEELQTYFEMCLNTYRSKPQVVKFYESAIFKIKHNNPIDVLVISDYNTVGLTGGDQDDEGNYVALMKSVGNSSKSTGEGGSKGLGKGAYFVASTFRTVFISSVYEKNKVVFQGKARLASFKQDEDNWIQGNGSYGLPYQKAVRVAEEIPEFFKRDEQGLDYYVIGFKADENWETQLARAVINWFWCAILKGQLVVDIGNSVKISDGNLDELIHKYFDIADKDSKDEPNPLPYYYAYTDKDHKEFGKKDKLPVLGKVSLYVLEKEGFPNTVAYIRKTGMVIQKNAAGSMNKYAATFICEDDYGNKVLRAMESETHTEWSKDNVSEESEYYEDAKVADAELRKFIRSSINEINNTQQGNVSTIGGLEEFLSLSADDDENGKNLYGEHALEEISAEETGYEMSIISEEEKAEIMKQKMDIIVNNKGGIVPGTPGGPLTVVGSNGKGGQGGGGTKDENGNIKVIDPKVINFYRTYATKEADGKIIHTIIIKNTPNFEADVVVNAGTEDSIAPINIIRAEDESENEYATSRNIIKGVKILGDGLLKMRVIFDTDERYSLNLTAI